MEDERAPTGVGPCRGRTTHEPDRQQPGLRRRPSDPPTSHRGWRGPLAPAVVVAPARAWRAGRDLPEIGPAVPDTRSHRGPDPRDGLAFDPSAWPALRAAVADLSWLLERGYAPTSALKLVGDRWSLTERQRAAVV